MHELSTGLEGQSKIDELGDSHSHKRPNLTVFQSLLSQAAIALLGFSTDKNNEYTVVLFAWMHKCNQMHTHCTGFSTPARIQKMVVAKDMLRKILGQVAQHFGMGSFGFIYFQMQAECRLLHGAAPGASLSWPVSMSSSFA